VSNEQSNIKEGFRVELFIFSAKMRCLEWREGNWREHWLEHRGEPFSQLVLGRAGHG